MNNGLFYWTDGNKSYLVYFTESSSSFKEISRLSCHGFIRVYVIHNSHVPLLYPYLNKIKNFPTHSSNSLI